MAEKVLVVGGGGREHALAWKLAQSPLIQQILVAPGNAGTANCGKISNSEVSVSNHAILAQFCKDHHVGLVLVGPEVPLAAGIVDDLTAAGVPCFGPSAKAAQLEASKSFSKAFMERHGLPTARYGSFTDAQEACSFIRTADFPALVVKASGLAAGKGVIVASNQEEACQAVMDIMKDRAFGSAGDTVVVEELLEGEEVSCLCFTDGFSVAAMPPAQDHKRLHDGDLGPNTGGMGAYCPTPQVSQEVLQQITESVLQKTVDGMREEGAPYVGVLYAGLMLTKEGPKVLEFNCRFGDPECQVLLPLLKSDLYEVILNTMSGKLASSAPVWHRDSSAVTVVMASAGYPGSYKKGVEITGLSQIQDSGLQVFHAGTSLKDGAVVSTGGRVLTVTAVKSSLEAALNAANQGVASVGFPGAVYRRDIAHRAIAHLKQHRGLTYKDSGVDIAAGNKLVEMIKPLAKATSRAGCNAELGGFAGLFDLKAAGFIDPILVSGTDGVGTKLKIAQACGQHGGLVRGVVLTPTKIYSRVLLPILRSGAVKAYAHITGGGLLENIPRVLPQELAVDLDASRWSLPPVFSWLHKEGRLSEEEMTRTFNCGLGAVLVVSPLDAQRVLRQLQAPEEAWIVGSLSHKQQGAEPVVVRNLKHSLMNAGPVSSGELAVNQNEGSHGDGCTPRKRTKVAVLISGTGTNLQALIEQARRPSSSAEIVLVISNRPGVQGLKRASLAGIQTRVVDHKLYGSRAEFDGTIDRVLEEFGVELVCLAGFMRILTGKFVKKWNGKLMNIHPSLLPSFKGVNAQRQALQAGVRVSGCTVHFVAEEVDAGAIIVQEAVPVLSGDSEESLCDRIREAEHRAFPVALDLVASGTVKLGEDGHIVWKSNPQS
ncbi:hypothetical protein CgunFtcFv8_018395 [Champsocephalus gunnari]|uniref:Trifunctional purine biosynthetic protein adenosine-3 n=1 Tax=Champsocephalus gunnari TaxID=52237 RepID=A0AAN8BTS3_CHAGU|nr:hypothetical protein CgunFtcFv8_018395 [Champsocephalus gunnari]